MEHYECLIPKNNKKIGCHESYIEMRYKLIKDLNIYYSDKNISNNNYVKNNNKEKEVNNNCIYVIGEKLDKNLFYENDYLFNDNNFLYISFCDFL